MEDLTGKQLGPYQVTEPLGEGGMAAVFKAYQPSMDRYVALKVLPRHFASDPEFIARFSQEARVIANLQHPHILPVHDFGASDGYTYLVMRYVEGGTLSDWLKPRTPLALEQIRDIIIQVGGALDYAHDQGVIHRDVKPSNVLVDQWDNCQLTDFGLAKMVAGTTHLTQTGGILGTPSYMSPEQGLGQKIDHRSDIYSLGVVLYQMSVGYLPYQAETPMAVVIKHIHDPLPPPRQRDPNLPEAVERVILKSLAKDPEDRFVSAGDLVRALQSATETPTVAVTPVSEPATPLPSQPTEPAVETIEATAVPILDTLPVQAEPAEVEEAVATPPTAAPVDQPRKSRLPWVLAVVGVLVIAALIFIVVSGMFGGDDEPDEPEQVEEIPAAVVTTGDGDEIQAPEPEEPPAAGISTGDDEIQPSESSPADPEALLGQLESAYDEGDEDRVGELLDRAIAVAPDMADLHCERGYILRDRDAFPEAVAAFEQCGALADEQDLFELNIEARGEMVLTEVRRVLSHEEDFDRALSIIDEAMADPSLTGWLQCERAEMNFSERNVPAATADFEACMEMNADDEYWRIRSQTAIHQMEGELALEREEYPAAVEHFSLWAELEPEEPWPFCFLGDAYNGLGDFDQATAAFEHCRAITDEPDAHSWAATGLTILHAYEAKEREDWPAALGAISEAIELSPDEAWLHCELGEVLVALEEFDEARHNYLICLEMSGDDVGTREWAEEMLHELDSASDD